MNTKTIAIICLLLCIPLAGFAEDIFPYQSDWAYEQVSASDGDIDLFFDEGFDTSSWSIGPGAFGSGSGCQIQEYVQTTWAVNTDLLLKREFELVAAGLAGVELGVPVAEGGGGRAARLLRQPGESRGRPQRGYLLRDAENDLAVAARQRPHVEADARIN